MVGAVEREISQRGELGFDPVQPGTVGRQEHELDGVGLAPSAGCRVFVRREVVQDQMQGLPWPAASQTFEEGEELTRSFPVADCRRRLKTDPFWTRGWVKKAETDAGDRPGTTSSDAERLAVLERENRELRRANQILKSAASFFAAELCVT